MAELESNENELGFVVNARLDNFRKQMAEYDARLSRMEKNTQKTTNSMEAMFKKMAGAFGAYMSVNAVQGFLNTVINVRGEFQKLEISFETMLGSQEKANALMKQLTETAARTPFDLQSVSQGAKQLLAYGTAAEDVNDTLIRLGNIASGLSIPLGDLVQLYGTTQTQGRIFTQDLRQFMGRGIPLAKELAKQFNTTESEVQALVTAGKVGFPEVKKALESLTDQGGKFFNLMEKQSASLSGQISNLEDSIDTMLNEIGKMNQELLSNGISIAATLVENYKTIAKVVLTMAEAYGTYKAAVVLSFAWEKRAILVRMTHIKLIKAQTIAQTALNAVTKLNPYIAIGAAIVGIGAMIATWRDRTDQQTAAQDRLNKKMKECEDRVASNSTAINESIAIIQDKTKSIYEQIKAYEELQKQEGSFKGKTMDEVKAMSSEEIAKTIQSDEMEQMTAESKRLLDSQRAAVEYWKGMADYYQNDKSKASTGKYEESVNKLKSAIDALANAENNYFNVSKKEHDLRMQADKQTLSNEELKKSLTEQNISLEKQVIALQEQQGKAKNDELVKSYQNEIDYIKKLIEANNSLNEATKDGNEDVVKDYNYWQQRAKEETDEFHKSLPGTKEWKQHKKNAEDAAKMMEQWESKAKQASETLEDLRKKWAGLAEQSKLETDLLDLSEFDRRRQENQNEYNAKVKELKETRDKDLERKDITNYIIKEINDRYNTALKGIEKTFIVNNELIAEDEKKYLKELLGTIAEYSKTELQNQLDEIDKDADEQIAELGAKLGTAHKDFETLKKQIRENAEKKKEDATVQSNIDNEKRLSDIRVKQIELTKALRGEENAELDIMYEREDSLRRQVKMMEDQKYGLTEAEQKNLEAMRLELAQLEADRKKFEEQLKELRNVVYEMFSKVGNSMSRSSNSYMSSFGGLINDISGAISSSKSISARMQSGDKIGAYGEAVSNAIAGAVDMFNLIYDQAQANKQALAEWDDAVRSSAQKLRMLELEQMDWKSSNLWGGGNPYEILQSYLSKATKASQMASESVQKLADAQVQDGTKKVVSAQNTLSGIGIGASTGASIGTAIGTAVPGIGNAIGLVVGALVGALVGGVTGAVAGMVEQPVYKKLKDKYGSLYDTDTLEINKQILADYDKMDDATKKLIDDVKELLSVQKEAMEEYKEYVAELTGDVSNSLSDSLMDAFTNGNIYKAVDDFRDYVKEQIQSIVQQKVFYSVFGDLLTNLTEQLTNGMTNTNGEVVGNIEDKLAEFPMQINNLLGVYSTLMTQYQDVFAKAGYDLYKTASEATQEALQGTISSMSEDTATKLNGNFMGLKLSAMEINANVETMKATMADANEIMAKSLQAINSIVANTNYCTYLERLDAMADDISEMKRNGILVR